MTVLERVVKWAGTSPEHRAVGDLDRSVTYRELVDEAQRVASAFAARGVNEGDRVVVLVPNSVDFVVAAFACMWFGAVFVPLATTDPPARLAMIVADCRPALIVTVDSVETTPATPAGCEIVTLDELKDAAPTIPAVDDSRRPAYMIYTSGTTGAPKGVQISTAAFAAAVEATARAVELDETTVTLCISPFHFDGSYANLFTTLYAGGTVIIRPRDALLFPRTFFNTVKSERVTYAGFTPSYLRLLLASPQLESLRASTLRLIALGGEAISAGELRALWSHAPALRVFNRYGPTETTIAVTHAELTPSVIEKDVVPMGAPRDGIVFYLLDDDGAVIDEAHRVGELYIAGDQLMDGYWNAPELTADVLRTDVVEGEMLYRTGDLVYRDDEGSYHFVGRSDRVVKRSGVRISLVEITEQMSRIEGVEAVACVTYDRDGEIAIAAFVVGPKSATPLELRRAASRLLPETMLPDHIHVVEALPINRSNKLDERRLLGDAGLAPREKAT